MWTCDCCGLENLDDSVRTCPACASSRYADAILTGSAGSCVLRLDLWFGNKNLRELIGEDAVYAQTRQFRVFKEDGAYFIACDPGAFGNPTFLDGVPVTETPLPLADGAVIYIGSRTRPDVRKGEITFSIH